MNAMTEIGSARVSWFLVRTKPPRNPGRRMVFVGSEYQAYRGRAGRIRKRRVAGTGERVFVPEMILTRAGFDVFYPKKFEWRVVNRYTKEKKLMPFPLLEGWMFVAWRDGDWCWPDIERLDVVAGVMGAGGVPVRVRHADMNRLFRAYGGKRFVSGDVQRFMRTRGEFDVGDRVEVLTGPYRTQTVEVLDITGDRAQCLIRMFGADVATAFRTYDLVKADVDGCG